MEPARRSYADDMETTEFLRLRHVSSILQLANVWDAVNATVIAELASTMVLAMPATRLQQSTVTRTASTSPSPPCSMQ